MKDLYGREIKGLRISITNKCNLNCIFCHREGIKNEKNGNIKNNEYITPEEIEKIVKIGKSFGISHVKITGGEPLLRNDIIEIIEKLKNLNIAISLTTNGHQLYKYAKDLKRAGVNHINISIHSLNPKIYNIITGGNLNEVMKGIDETINNNIFIKFNVTILKGLNDNEIQNFIEFSKGKGVLQLIELINFNNEIYKKYHVHLEEIENNIKEKAEKISIRKLHNRKKYYFDGAEIEIVKPMDNTDFCMHCTRIRLTHDGKLKPCLMRDDNLVDILTPLRNNASDDELKEIFRTAVMRREPYFKSENILRKFKIKI